MWKGNKKPPPLRRRKKSTAWVVEGSKVNGRKTLPFKVGRDGVHTASPNDKEREETIAFLTPKEKKLSHQGGGCQLKNKRQGNLT